jgi:hypothetical protein
MRVEPAGNRLADARTEALSLIERIDNVLDALDEPTPWRLVNTDRGPGELQERMEREEDELRRYLEFLQPSALLLYAGILVRSGNRQDAEKQLALVDDSARLNARVQYNLACFYSESGSANDARSPEQRTRDYVKALDHLQRALSTAASGELARFARADPSLAGVRTARATDFNEILARSAPAA